MKSFELNIFLETSQAVKQIDVLILLNGPVQGGLNKHWGRADDISRRLTVNQIFVKQLHAMDAPYIGSG